MICPLILQNTTTYRRARSEESLVGSASGYSTNASRAGVDLPILAASFSSRSSPDPACPPASHPWPGVAAPTTPPRRAAAGPPRTCATGPRARGARPDAPCPRPRRARRRVARAPGGSAPARAGAQEAGPFQKAALRRRAARKLHGTRNSLHGIFDPCCRPVKISPRMAMFRQRFGPKGRNF